MMSALLAAAASGSNSQRNESMRQRRDGGAGKGAAKTPSPSGSAPGLARLASMAIAASRSGCTVVSNTRACGNAAASSLSGTASSARRQSDTAASALNCVSSEYNAPRSRVGSASHLESTAAPVWPARNASHTSASGSGWLLTCGVAGKRPPRPCRPARTTTQPRLPAPRRRCGAGHTRAVHADITGR